MDNSVPIPPIVGDNSLCAGNSVNLALDNLPSGGDTSSVNGYRIHTFTGNGTFTVPAGLGSLNAEVLVVGGGGGGGNGRGGGGGGGGVVYSNVAISGSTSITVGNGGAAATNGENSSFGTIVALGGGRGGSHLNNDNGGNGGSGGGAAMNYNANIWSGGLALQPGSASGGAGQPGAGSDNAGIDDPRNTGGGGGGGTAGIRGQGTNIRPDGGQGIASDISGFTAFYGGGGGGARGGTDRASAGAGVGGMGGGGTGGGDYTQTAGAPNTGGGGGGSEGTGSSGGSGIVIIRYPDPRGGTWSSSSPATASVHPATGTVTGNANGGTNINYTITSPIGCTATVSHNVAVKTMPAVPNVSDDSPTCEGLIVNLASTGLAPGGQAFLGNGTNSAIEVVHDIPEHNFTIEMWVKTSSTNSGIFSVADGAYGANGHDRHFYLNNGELWVRIWQGSGWNTGITINDNQWHHLALTVETGQGQRVYVDGVLAGTNPYDHSDFDWQTRFYIGFSNDAVVPHFNGEIDNVRIWNVVRTQNEIVQNMNRAVPSGSGLISNYLLNGNANAAVGINGTATNAAWSIPAHYTYTWSGPYTPSPASSTDEDRILLNAGNGLHTLTVTASDGQCASGNATTDVDIKANNQPASEWNGNIDSDWFHPLNWTDCRPGPATEVTIPRDVLTQRYPEITATSPHDSGAVAGQAKAKKVSQGTISRGGPTSRPHLQIRTGTELRVEP